MLDQPKATILTIDDDKYIRDSFSSYLEKFGFRMLEAESGAEGLEIFEKAKPDLVLVDLFMPKMGGLEVLAILKKKAPETPLIVVSGRGMMPDAIEALRLGAWDYILKPIEDMSILRHSVGKALERARMNRENIRYGRQLEEAVRKRATELEFSNAALMREVAERKRAEKELQKHRDLLEKQVADRTEELTKINLELQEEIKERKNAENEARALSRVKGEFLANISHEIRTPLNGILGMTEILLGTEFNAVQRNYLEIVRKAGKSLLAIVSDVLDFSKIEEGRFDIEMIDFDLRTTLDDLNDFLKINASDKGLKYNCSIDANVYSRLRGDPGRLRQILMNLVGNAIKFTTKGEVSLQVSLIREDEKSVILRFRVKDTGIGIEKDKLESLFEPFTQADSSTTRKYGGTGLGLSISKRLCELMGGEIGVESSLGEGSLFWFTSAFEKQLSDVKPELEFTEDIRGKRILVVDDNKVNRMVLEKQISTWGSYYKEASSAQSALSKMEKVASSGENFDIVLVDLQMPGMDGVEFAKVVRERTKIKDIPLILLTSLGERGDAGLYEEAGFDAYLIKPVDMNLLFDCIRAILPREKKKSGSMPLSIITRHKIAENRKYGIRILLAEDNRANREVITLFIKKMGYRVDLVANGLEALEAVKKKSYDVVLMDINMPEMDGFTAAKEIRNLDPDKSDVPIVAMTGYEMEDERERFMEAGIYEHLLKPFNWDELSEVLHKVFTGPKVSKIDKENFEEDGVPADPVGD
ncbi:response regulator [Thermodesulfobacteriota bacterium]